MTSELTRMLNRLQATDGTDLVAVVTMDGLLIDHVGGDGIDPIATAAAASNGLLLARALGGELDRGEPVMITVEYARGLLVLQPLDEDLGLVILAPKETNLGRLRLVMRRYAQELIQAVGI